MAIQITDSVLSGILTQTKPWVDSREGTWETERQALEYIEDEVCVPAIVCRVGTEYRVFWQED